MSWKEWGLVAVLFLGLLAAALGSAVAQRWLTGLGLLAAIVAFVGLALVFPQRPAQKRTSQTGGYDPVAYWILVGTMILLGIIGLLSQRTLW